MSLSLNGKGCCCSFLMVCNGSTAWCFEINYERDKGVKGKTQKDCSTECAVIWQEGGIKQRGRGQEEWGCGGGGQTRQRTKMGNPLKVWEKICCLSVNGIGSPHGWCYGTIKWSYKSPLIENLESVCDTAAITNGGLIKVSQTHQKPA